MRQDERGIGSRIAEARHAANLSQTELAALTGYAARTIQSWELDDRHPRHENLCALAEALDRSVAWFYAPAEPDTKAAA